ncbi:energy transducer TonB [Andreprevotia lacus]|nr:energy transducer TonB [Andreprevotia lacus]
MPHSPLRPIRYSAVLLVLAAHVAVLYAIVSAREATAPVVEPPALTVIELPTLVSKPESQPQPAPQPLKPQPQKAQPKPQPVVQQPVSKPLKPAPDLPKSETAPVVAPETAKPVQEVKEAREAPAAPAKQAEPAAAAEPPSQPSVQANYLSMPRSYPAQSRTLGEEGTVTIRVVINEEGRPVSTEVAKSSGFARLDEDAKRTVMKWRFNPGKVNGKPVTQAWNVPVVYKLTN